jgi:malonate decarboxylase gamma subunit
MVHVMPLTSIARITKIDIEKLETMANDNPVFAAGVDFFYRLGGVDEIIEDLGTLPQVVINNINEVRLMKKSNQVDQLGPWGRGLLGQKRGGRQTRQLVLDKMFAEFNDIASKYI